VGGIELVVTDLDGTLWSYEQADHPDARTLAAWRTLELRGIPVVVATGRRVSTTRDPLAELGLAPCAIVLNGALALDLATGDCFHRHQFDPARAAAVLEAFRAHGLDPCVYVEHDDLDAYVSDQPSTSPSHLASLGPRAVCADLDDVVATSGVLSFGVFGLAESALRDVASTVGDHGEARVLRDTWSEHHGLTVAPVGLSKWTGVVAYCELHGVDPSRVLAIGDEVNDLELIASAAIGVAMADAPDSVLAVADHVVPPTAEGGWAVILDLV
jgi:hypothetical protein